MSLESLNEALASFYAQGVLAESSPSAVMAALRQFRSGAAGKVKAVRGNRQGELELHMEHPLFHQDSADWEEAGMYANEVEKDFKKFLRQKLSRVKLKFEVRDYDNPVVVVKLL